VRRAAVLALVTGALVGAPAAAAADCPRTTLGDIEDEVMCPVCGTPLSLATEAPQAIQERRYIERLIADCRSKDEIKEALAAQFGDAVLALPGDSGDDDFGDVLVYVVPAVGIALAAGGIALSMRRWRRGGGPRTETADGAAEGERRLEADMERYEL
jgi:cytochrome c-type biogenesis protein CcmH